MRVQAICRGKADARATHLDEAVVHVQPNQAHVRVDEALDACIAGPHHGVAHVAIGLGAELACAGSGPGTLLDQRTRPMHASSWQHAMLLHKRS